MNKTKAIVNRTIMDVNGALYEKSEVKIDKIDKNNKKIRVIDGMGRIFWVLEQDINIINP